MTDYATDSDRAAQFIFDWNEVNRKGRITPKNATFFDETLRDDAAALEYACDMAREFRNSGSGSHDPNLMIKVRDENRQIIFSIPFRAGSA